MLDARLGVRRERSRPRRDAQLLGQPDGQHEPPGQERAPVGLDAVARLDPLDAVRSASLAPRVEAVLADDMLRVQAEELESGPVVGIDEPGVPAPSAPLCEPTERVRVEVEVVNAGRAQIRHPRGAGHPPERIERLRVGVKDTHAIGGGAAALHQGVREVRAMDAAPDDQPVEREAHDTRACLTAS
ncbi:hypothetical protein BE08_05820 [Sorangium cellulosum]|uniref:Uncharacterized protein n=1 Tax=Sorangium cellulosum TaxID=56 RepID=A0A150PAT7_SORCE|nr:hypothetical protein BE08_05820 [Sorangium cellulosum]